MNDELTKAIKNAEQSGYNKAIQEMNKRIDTTLSKSVDAKLNGIIEQVEEEFINDIFDSMDNGEGKEFRQSQWLDFKNVVKGTITDELKSLKEGFKDNTS